MSNQFTLNIRDFLKGLVVAVIVPALLAVQQAITNQTPIDWKLLGGVALASFIGYLIKNFFSNDIPAAQATINEARKKEANKIG